MKYDESVCTANGSLRFEPAGNAVRVVTSTFCAGTAGKRKERQHRALAARSGPGAPRAHPRLLRRR